MSITVKVEGLSELKDAIEALPKAVGNNVLRQVLLARAEPIAALARQKAPVGRSGRLRDSIIVQSLGSGGAGKAAFAAAMSGGASRAEAGRAAHAANSAAGNSAMVAIGPNKKIAYAHMVEFGSAHNPVPKPFIRPAWDSLKGSLLDNIKEDLWAEIQKAVDKMARKAAKAKG